MAKMKNPSARAIAGYGWTPDIPDMRDHAYKPPYGSLKNIPAKSDLTKTRGYFPAYDQGELGSCTANAIAAALEFDMVVQKLPQEVPSRLAIYYGERVIEGTVKTDAGAQIRDGLKVVSTAPVPTEVDWPYDISQFTKKPPAGTAGSRATVYRRLSRDNTLAAFRACLGVEKRPFAFGFSVYESFEAPEVADTGIVPMPTRGEQLLGGHAVLAVGYDDKKQMALVRNSWGPDWGIAGHFWLPYAFLTTHTLSADFWTIGTIEETP